MHPFSSKLSSRRVAKSQDSWNILMVVQKRATRKVVLKSQKALCQIDISSKVHAAELKNMMLKWEDISMDKLFYNVATILLLLRFLHWLLNFGSGLFFLQCAILTCRRSVKRISWNKVVLCVGGTFVTRLCPSLKLDLGFWVRFDENLSSR